MKTSIVLIIAAVIIAGGAIAAVSLFQDSPDMMENQMSDTDMENQMSDTDMENQMSDTDMMSESMSLPDIVNVGVMLPATGDIASHGHDSNIAVELAAEDFNKYLQDKDAGWSVNLIIEDTQTDPVVALEKIQSLNSKGVNFILGTQSSSELRNIKPYADSNGIILLSPSSTSPKLAIDDTIFRLVPDDTQQGVVIAELLQYHDIQVVIAVYRADVWGDGLYASSRDNAEMLGIVVDEGIRYSPEGTTFSNEVDLIDAKVQQYMNEGYNIDNIAILMISFSEAVHLMNFAGSSELLRTVQWFGSDASSNDDAITNDPLAIGFANDVNLITTQFAASDNETYEHVKAHFESVKGSAPSNYAYSAYDSLWVLGKTIESTDSIETDVLKSALPDIAAEHTGSIGKVIFNEFGDLAISDYEIWSVDGSNWISLGKYVAETGQLEFDS